MRPLRLGETHLINQRHIGAGFNPGPSTATQLLAVIDQPRRTVDLNLSRIPDPTPVLDGVDRPVATVLGVGSDVAPINVDDEQMTPTKNKSTICV
jgi:hypothetical protein